MTDSAPPNATTDPAGDPDAAATARPRRYTADRVFVGVLFFAITGYTIVNGCVRIYRDTYREPAATPAFRTCSDGIHGLFGGFSTQLANVASSGEGPLAPRRPSSDTAVRASLAVLDESLLGLRRTCDREGTNASDAYQALTLWRFKAQDLSRLAEQALNPDAERALRYQSPAQP